MNKQELWEVKQKELLQLGQNPDRAMVPAVRQYYQKPRFQGLGETQLQQQRTGRML